MQMKMQWLENWAIDIHSWEQCKWNYQLSIVSI